MEMNRLKKILVVEDEDVIREFVVINLKRAGYDVTDVPNGEEALRVFEQQNGEFDVALLDIMMPGIDGFQVCKEIRRRSSSIGIILLSAKSQEMDKVSGLMMGADDYVTKPFSPSELVARVDAIHRRVTMIAGRAEESSVLSSGPFVLNLKSRSLHKNGKEIDLTQVEFQIMEFFMSNPGTALERSEILNKVWGEGYFGDVKIVDVNIRRLRMKIEDKPSEPQYLLTVWGFGYKWNA
jgi:two-component system response regulator RegX3